MRLFWFQIACSCATFSSIVMRPSEIGDAVVHRTRGIAIDRAVLRAEQHGGRCDEQESCETESGVGAHVELGPLGDTEVTEERFK